MNALNKALGLEDPSRMATYRRIAELTAPIAEAAVDCLIGKAAAEATNEKQLPGLVRLKMIQLYSGVAAQLALVMNDAASLKRELAERSQPVDAEGINR
jgi:hypothetical protein